MSRNAARESFQIIQETCPAVDAAAQAFSRELTETIENRLEGLISDVKSQTTALREALIGAIQERNEARKECDDFENEVARLNDVVKDLSSEVKRLQMQISELETQ